MRKKSLKGIVCLKITTLLFMLAFLYTFLGVDACVHIFIKMCDDGIVWQCMCTVHQHPLSAPGSF